MTKGKHLAVADLNEDVLLTLARWFEALELLSWGMTCKRLYQTIEAKILWINIAQRLEEESIYVPLAYGETIHSSSLLALKVATTRACRLRRNLNSPEPRLYRSTRIKLSRNPFKREYIPEEAQDCVHIFDGRWILYRRPDHLCVRHVEATKQKEIFDIPIVGFAGWAFQVTQVAKNVALVTSRHDVNEVWGLMEITFGEDKRTKPTVRDVNVGDPYKICLPGSSYAVTTKNGVTSASEVYSGQKTVLGQDYTMQREFLCSNGLLFNLHFQPGGRLQLTAQRMNDPSKDRLLGSRKSTLNINLKQSLQFYPPDTFSVKESIRATSDELVTIWHRIHMKHEKTVYYALFVIDVPYLVKEEEEDGEAVIWGDWTCRGSYMANGQQFVGTCGESLLLTRQVDGMAALTVYPRFRLPSCDWDFRMTNQGISLPVPPEKVPGNGSHAIRVAWDDARGIAVLMLETGMLWVLQYA